MNLDRYQQWLLDECRKIAKNSKDIRPGMPIANVPLDALGGPVQQMIDAGMLKVIKAAPSGRRTLTYLVIA